ncbi:hypothetical protein I4P06_03310 [Enterobacter asburiae]|uniref:RipA family octameric membrane protein n=1 Tax=Enterobacter cloacae complex TaxID=354276 RepID=UPI000E4AAFA1|nr:MULTISPECIES: hypothetical protein [Enterobacter]MBG0637038.1 hypothetical protein [Enterobacter asburiae]MCY0771257.1 hypothetical protein [Enterobacter cloacae complex sp. 2022EL-00788]RHI05737.1 hypothetical protein DW184_01195 [Enterobacter cloacae]
MSTHTRNYNLPSDLIEHFEKNIAYFSKLLNKDFKDLNVNITADDLKKIERSFEISHKIREFEIGLYWQRLNYLWAITALLFAGWGALIIKIIDLQNGHVPYSIFFSLAFVSLVGCILSIFTSFIIIAGKHWQKVWEYHVYTLEPFVSGCLYSIKFKNSNPKNVKASITKTVEVFNFSLLILWVLSAIIAAIMPSQISNSMAGWIQLLISSVMVVLFLLIRKEVTNKTTDGIEMDV